MPLRPSFSTDCDLHFHLDPSSFTICMPRFTCADSFRQSLSRACTRVISIRRATRRPNWLVVNWRCLINMRNRWACSLEERVDIISPSVCRSVVRLWLYMLYRCAQVHRCTRETIMLHRAALVSYVSLFFQQLGVEIYQAPRGIIWKSAAMCKGSAEGNFYTSAGRQTFQ